MSLNDMYLLGVLVVIAVAVDVLVGNLRASYEGRNNSSSGIKGIVKKAIILSLTITMMLLLFLVNTFGESNQLIFTVGSSYTTVLSALGYHEIQSILANVKMTYPDINIPNGVYKFFNIESEIINKENKEK